MNEDVYNMIVNVILETDTKKLDKLKKELNRLGKTRTNLDKFVDFTKQIQKLSANFKLLNKYGLEYRGVTSKGLRTGLSFYDVQKHKLISLKDAMVKVAEYQKYVIKNNKGLRDQVNIVKKGYGWFDRFRGGWLGLYFAAKMWANVTDQALKPAEDLLGISKLQTEFNAIKYLPVAQKKLKNLQKQISSYSKLSDEEKKNQANITETTNKISHFTANLGQTVLGVWAVGNAFKDLKLIFSKETMTSALMTLEGAFNSLGESMSNLAGGFGISGGVIVAIITLLIAAIAGFIKLWNENFKGIQDRATAAWKVVGPIFKLMYLIFKDLWDIVSNFLGGILVGILGDFFDKIIEGKGIFQTFADILQKVHNFLKGIAKGAKEVGYAIGNFLGKNMFGQWLINLFAPHKYATGGIVTQPTLALVGENGPEKIEPITNNNYENKQNVYVNINMNSTLNEQNKKSFIDELLYELKGELSRTRLSL